MSFNRGDVYSNNPASARSMAQSFVVQDPYGTGQPDFMAGGSAPSHFTRQGLQGIVPGAIGPSREEMMSRIGGLSGYPGLDPETAGRIQSLVKQGTPRDQIAYKFNVDSSVVDHIAGQLGHNIVQDKPVFNTDAGRRMYEQKEQQSLNDGQPSQLYNFGQVEKKKEMNMTPWVMAAAVVGSAWLLFSRG